MSGIGSASCHHGEILQGVFLDGRGRTSRGLVTLPMPGPHTTAEFTPRPGRLVVRPGGRDKAARAATLAIEECARRTGKPRCGGELRLSGAVPVGLGMGSSTCDIIASVRAVAASFGTRLPAQAVARIAVRAECAADPLMLDPRPVLFAQREGRILEKLGCALPSAIVVGCLTGGGRPVNTLALPAADRAAEVTEFERLRALLRRAIHGGDLRLLGAVSSESAERNQRVLHKEELPVLREIADRTGAAGVQVAHSGNVAGLLFDPAAPDLGRRLRSCMRLLRRNDIPPTHTFRTHQPDPRRPAHGRAHRGRDRQTGPGTARRAAGVPAVRDHEGGLRDGRGPAPARPGHGSAG